MGRRFIVVISLFLRCFTLVYCASDINFDITCGEQDMVAHWEMPVEAPQPFNNTRKLNVMLLDPDCNDTSSSGNGTTHASYATVGSNLELNLTARYDECGMNVHNMTDYIIINNTATLKVTETLRSGGTKRVYYYEYHMTCQLRRNWNVTTGNSNYTVDYKVTNITKEYNKTENFNFDFSLDFYTDSSFNTEHSPGPITVNTNEFIYTKLKEDNPNSHFKFIVNECAASPTTGYDVSTADIFFQDGCRLDGTFDILSPVDANDSFSFKIQAFSYIQEQSAVYFHCKVYICKTDSSATDCIQQCKTTGQRQRREITEEDNGRVDEKVVTSRLLVFNREVSCDDITCSINSKCAPLKPARCICDDDYVFSRIENKCVKERIAQIENIHLNKEWNENYADPKHPDFLSLALKYEDVLYKSFIAAGVTREIEGVRIISASPGSIVLKTRIIYGRTVTPQEAYNGFVKSITSKALDATTVRRELELLTDRTPAIVEIEKKMAEIQKLTLIIIIVVLLLVVLLTAIVIVVIRRKRKSSRKLEVNGVDNGGIEISKYN